MCIVIVHKEVEYFTWAVIYKRTLCHVVFKGESSLQTTYRRASIEASVNN